MSDELAKRRAARQREQRSKKFDREADMIIHLWLDDDDTIGCHQIAGNLERCPIETGRDRARLVTRMVHATSRIANSMYEDGVTDDVEESWRSELFMASVITRSGFHVTLPCKPWAADAEGSLKARLRFAKWMIKQLMGIAWPTINGALSVVLMPKSMIDQGK